MFKPEGSWTKKRTKRLYQIEGDNTLQFFSTNYETKIKLTKREAILEQIINGENAEDTFKMEKDDALF